MKHQVLAGDPTAALASFAADIDNQRIYGTLLNYLLADRRGPTAIDELRPLLAVPQQVTRATVGRALFHLPARLKAPWAAEVFEAVLQRAPDRIVADALDLPLVVFSHHDDAATLAWAVSLIADRYGVRAPLVHGQNLMSAVVRHASSPAIAALQQRGGHIEVEDSVALLESTELGWVSAEQLPSLLVDDKAVRAVPHVVSRYLIGARQAAHEADEVRAAVRTLFKARLSNKRLPYDRVEPASLELLGRPVAAALSLHLPVADRVALVDEILAAGHDDGRPVDALPATIAAFQPAGLADLLAAVGHQPGAVFGPRNETLLHIAARCAPTHLSSTRDGDVRGVFEALLACGESTSATTARGKTALALFTAAHARVWGKTTFDDQHVATLLKSTLTATRRAPVPQQVPASTKTATKKTATKKTATKKTATTKAATKKTATKKTATKKAATEKAATKTSATKKAATTTVTKTTKKTAMKNAATKKTAMER